MHMIIGPGTGLSHYNHGISGSLEPFTLDQQSRKFLLRELYGTQTFLNKFGYSTQGCFNIRKSDVVVQLA